MCQAIRTYEELRGSRLIGVGVGLTDGQGQALLQEGFSGYLRKPFEFRQLQDLFERIAEQSN
jgi:CheY-like chemotaxis protein